MAPKKREREAENDSLKIRAMRVVSSSAGQQGQRNFPESLGTRQGSLSVKPNPEPNVLAQQLFELIDVTTLPVQRARVPPLKKWDAVGQLVPYAAPAAT